MISHVAAETVSIKSGQKSWLGASYLCPFCNVILGVGVDPIALKADTVQEVIDGLRGAR
jgi:hypothetical protein